MQKQLRCTLSLSLSLSNSGYIRRTRGLRNTETKGSVFRLTILFCFAVGSLCYIFCCQNMVKTNIDENS